MCRRARCFVGLGSRAIEGHKAQTDGTRAEKQGAAAVLLAAAAPDARQQLQGRADHVGIETVFLAVLCDTVVCAGSFSSCVRPQPVGSRGALVVMANAKKSLGCTKQGTRR